MNESFRYAFILLTAFTLIGCSDNNETVLPSGEEQPPVTDLSNSEGCENLGGAQLAGQYDRLSIPINVDREIVYLDGTVESSVFSGYRDSIEIGKNSDGQYEICLEVTEVNVTNVCRGSADADVTLYQDMEAALAEMEVQTSAAEAGAPAFADTFDSVVLNLTQGEDKLQILTKDYGLTETSYLYTETASVKESAELIRDDIIERCKDAFTFQRNSEPPIVR